LTPQHEASVWLGEAMACLLTRVAAGKVRACRHLRPGMPMLTALWAADRVVCMGCVRTLNAAGDEDRRCDRCGIVADPGQIYPSMTSPGPSGSLLVLLGLCSTCMRREVA
jgi:hypothetical protein